MRNAKVALAAIIASLVSALLASGIASAATLGGGGEDDGYPVSSSSTYHTPSPAPNPAPVQSSSTPSGGGGGLSSIPGVPASFAACVAWRESGNGSASSNVYGIIPASGYNGYALSLAGQKQAFAALYAKYGTAPWAPYDGC
jgi:hypothetical protein